MKNTLLFTYNTSILVRQLTINIHKYEELSYPQNPKMCDPIQVTLLKMQPRYSQTSCENATPSSDTSPLASNKEDPPEAAWPSGQRVGLAIRRSRVRVPLWPLAVFVLGRPEFKFSATLVNSQLVAFCQLGFLILLCCI